MKVFQKEKLPSVKKQTDLERLLMIPSSSMISKTWICLKKIWMFFFNLDKQKQADDGHTLISANTSRENLPSISQEGNIGDQKYFMDMLPKRGSNVSTILARFSEING